MDMQLEPHAFLPYQEAYVRAGLRWALPRIGWRKAASGRGTNSSVAVSPRSATRTGSTRR